MKSIFFLLSCLVGLALASDVVELTDSDFDSDIGNYDTALVEFYAPWCGHCKKLAPEYETAATALKRNDPPVALVKVDCIANTKVCGKHGVSGYPTLKIFRGGELSSDYDGQRSSDGIISYMKKQVQPASRELETVEAFEKFTTGYDAVVIGFFSDAESKDAKAFDKLSSALRDDYTFGHSYSAEVNEKAEFSDAVVLYRPKRLSSKFDDTVVQMTESVSQSNVKSFLSKNFFGLCGHMTVDNSDKFTKPLLTAYYDVDYVKNPKGTNYWRNRVMKVGQEFKEKLNFAVANQNDFSHILTEAGLTFKELPVVMIKDKEDKKYVMEVGKDVEAKQFMDELRAFITSYEAGEISPKIKSEPVPESNDGPVKVVVGETFDEIVMDETKDVLIEFYAPWCGHCKSLAPKYDEVGEKLKENENLVIAKMDATANDSPSQFQVSGFPTIYWAPKGNKKNPVKYNGGREVADFISYLEQHATDKLKKTEL